MKKLSVLFLAVVFSFISCGDQANLDERSQYLYQQVERLTFYEVYDGKPLADCVDLSAFSNDFAAVIQEAAAYEKAEYEKDEESFELGFEFFCYWLRGQDSGPNDGFKELNVTGQKASAADVDILYVLYDQQQHHKMKLIKEKGEWVIDNFDTQKEDLRDVLKSLREAQ